MGAGPGLGGERVAVAPQPTATAGGPAGVALKGRAVLPTVTP
jgi:hypothetical protein